MGAKLGRPRQRGVGAKAGRTELQRLIGPTGRAKFLAVQGEDAVRSAHKRRGGEDVGGQVDQTGDRPLRLPVIDPRGGQETAEIARQESADRPGAVEPRQARHVAVQRLVGVRVHAQRQRIGAQPHRLQRQRRCRRRGVGWRREGARGRRHDLRALAPRPVRRFPFAAH